MRSKAWFTCLVLVMFGSAALAQPQTPVGPGWPDLPEARALLQVAELIEARYGQRDLDEAALWRGALEGMIRALPDEVSWYTDPETLAWTSSLDDADLGYSGMTLWEPDPRAVRGVQVRQV